MMPKHKQIEWNDENITRFWDYTSQFPELYFTFQFGYLMIKRFKSYLRGKKSVLDYGCGTGFLIPHLLEQELDVTGVEFSDKSIEYVNGKFHIHPHFHGVHKIEQILAKDKKFDVIFLVETIEHLTDSHLEKTFGNMKKLLSTDGIIIITTPNDEKLSDSNVFCPECQSEFHRWQHIRSWSEENLESCVTKNGFSIVKSFTTDFSVSIRKSAIGYLKYVAKRILRYKLPHLVFILKIKD